MNPEMKDKKEQNTNSLNNKEQRHISKRMFTKQEDSLIICLVSQYGINNWKQVSSRMINRTPRQCRERWKYYLSPNVDNKPWTIEEDQLLEELTKTLGNQWAQIAKHFENRTCINVKNRKCLLQRMNQKSEFNQRETDANEIIICENKVLNDEQSHKLASETYLYTSQDHNFDNMIQDININYLQSKDIWGIGNNEACQDIWH